jgi:hypothetical protein
MGYVNAILKFILLVDFVVIYAEFDRNNQFDPLQLSAIERGLKHGWS